MKIEECGIIFLILVNEFVFSVYIINLISSEKLKN